MTPSMLNVLKSNTSMIFRGKKGKERRRKKKEHRKEIINWPDNNGIQWFHLNSKGLKDHITNT
jgi:hypothetical protein